MKLTAEMAFEKSEAGEPALLSAVEVQDIMDAHGIRSSERDEYRMEMMERGADPLDSANLMGWLGY